MAAAARPWGARPGRIAVLGASALLLAACGANDGSDVAAAPSSLERAVASGKIRVGYANEAPFAYMDSRAAQLTGEAPEIARHVLGKLGVTQIEGVLTEFGALIPGLLAGRFDIIAAGMYVLPERCRQIAFSEPTYGVGEAFLQRADHATPLRSYAQVARDRSVKLGVVVGAVQTEYAQRAGILDDQLVVFPDVVSAVEGVEAGRADAYAATSLTVNHILTKVPDWEVDRVPRFRQPLVDGEPVRGYGAFGFRRQDTELLSAFNRELAGLLGSPEHRQMVEPFGFTEQELPGDTTTAALCGPAPGVAP